MIRSMCYDVEIFPNMFSVTFVDMASYLETFKDACSASGGKPAPVPLTEVYPVEEIKRMLAKVKSKAFYITDKDDSQLVQMLGYINSTRAHYEDDVPVRVDMFGYNSNKYDKLMIAALLMYAGQAGSSKELIAKLHETSRKIISLQNDPDAAKSDYLLNALRKYSIPFKNVDVMTIFALNKVGKGEDKEGNVTYFGKSLKQTSINLKWYELLEHQLPPVSEADVGYYQSKRMYKGLDCKQIDQLVDKWDRYILDEWIPGILHYNMNDVYIVCEMIRLFVDEIRLRYSISKAYGVDVLSSSRSNIADRLFVKFYSEFSGLPESRWRGKRTERTAMAFSKVIFPFIKFKTPAMQELLEEMRKVTVYRLGKKALKEVASKYSGFKYLKTNTDSGWFEVKMNNLVYTIATGGLHSQDVPRELKSRLVPLVSSPTGEQQGDIWAGITDDSYVYVHADVSSFYPSMMDVYNIAPAHLDKKTFVKLVHWLKETRVTAKHSKEKLIDGIPKDVLAQVLKIVINSIYGKMGSEKSEVYDRLAVLKVTINGQLVIMMLCEELELNGIEVVSANTDGIVVKLYKKDKKKFDEISGNWQQFTGLSVDSEEYELYVNRDINNYLIKEIDGKVSYKGVLNPKMYLVDMQKGYNAPVVARAVSNYFLLGKPILETLYECKDILDFCMTENIGRQFRVEYASGSKRETLQNNVRFYVSTMGGSIEKVNRATGARNGLCAGYKVSVLNTLDDMPIEYRNIRYNYYLNEAMKIIDPIKLNISPNQKGDRARMTKSGKVLIRKYSGAYVSLFDNAEDYESQGEADKPDM